MCSRTCADDCGCPSDHRCQPTATPGFNVCVPGVSACAGDAGAEGDGSVPPLPVPPRDFGDGGEIPESQVTVGGGCATTPTRTPRVVSLAALAATLGLLGRRRRAR
jgi:hypothetical protein